MTSAMAAWAAMLLAPPCFAQTPAPPAAAPTLDDLLKSNTHAVKLAGTSLSGPGAGRIAAMARAADFLMLGEAHGSAGIAAYATAIAGIAEGAGFGATAIETDPLMADILTREIKAGTLDAWFATDQRSRAIPFYFWREEAGFARTALGFGPLWGLDQSFILGAHVHFDAIAAMTRNARLKAAASAMAVEARARLSDYLGATDPVRISALASLVDRRDPPGLKILIEQLAQSAAIYAPFTTGKGSVFAANLKREAQMKRLFLAQWRAAGRPKTLFKFGANHLQTGLSATHVPSFGNFVSELALIEDKRATNIYLVCGPGASTATMDGGGVPCDGDFARDYAFLAPHLAPGAATLLETAALRDRPRLWRDLTETARGILWSYDALLIVTQGGPATFIAAQPPQPRKQ